MIEYYKLKYLIIILYKYYLYHVIFVLINQSPNTFTNMYKQLFDYAAVLGDVINDEIERKLVLEGLQKFDQQEATLPKNRPQNKIDPMNDRYRGNVMQIFDRQQLNFQDDLDGQGGKKYKMFNTYEPQKFRILGHNAEGKPLFKISDIFLTSDPKLRSIIDRCFDQIIHGGSKNVILETGQISKRNERDYDFSKLIQNWEKKQYEDFTNDKKNQMDEKQLEQIVVNRGDSKDNYWIYKIGEKKKYDYQDIYEQKYIHRSNGNQNGSKKQMQMYNYNLLNPKFIENMHKAANRMRLQYSQIQQFQSDQQKNTNQNNTEQQNNNEWLQQRSKNQEAEQQYWGQFPLDPKAKQSRPNNAIKTVLLEQEIQQVSSNIFKKDGNKYSNQNSQSRNVCTFVDEIIKEYNTINHQIVNNCYNGKDSLNQYNRIQFHLENPNFFLTKLHSALQKKSQQLTNFLQGSKNMEGIMNKNTSALSALGLNQSVVSGSRTGNQQTVRNSQMEVMQGLNQDDDHQTIQNKINRQMSSQPKKPIIHSQIANKLHFIKFSNQTQNYRNYHRYELRYDHYFEHKVKINLLRHTKPIKCKGTDLNINIQKKDSYTKFSKPQSLSLASDDIKQFILVEYIEQNPLLLSDVGMSQRMILQVNNKQVLQKINRDIIEQKQLDQFEEIRDNPKTKNDRSTTTQHKMELWRENIKKYFGENGKVYLWQPKRQSKLIGNPEGLGIALMESNLSNVPIVKKTPNKRDFILVRERTQNGDKWVLRKIDYAYVSGQVQPKQVVFSPGDRPYQTFLQKYQVDFLTKMALNSINNKISIETVKACFPNTPHTSAQSRIRKIIKQKMNAETKDNKVYQIKFNENEQIKFKLQPEQFCLFQRMQKSLCELEEAGIRFMKNMQKMKSILRKYFRKTKNRDLQRFAVSRMIRDQLQLTSWYLTQSFRKFIDKNARIQMVGHADPTNGHGGYSFIKKPQKERTDKDEAQQKQERNKLSGTQYDLRKLIKLESVSVLEQMGYSREQLANKGRWQLVHMLKNQKDTQYSRKQRETKQLKEQNERKQRSKALNTLLKYLKNQEQGLIQAYQYGYQPFLEILFYCERQKDHWKLAKEKLQKNAKDENDQNEDQGDEGDD